MISHLCSSLTPIETRALSNLSFARGHRVITYIVRPDQNPSHFSQKNNVQYCTCGMVAMGSMAITIQQFPRNHAIM